MGLITPIGPIGPISPSASSHAWPLSFPQTSASATSHSTDSTISSKHAHSSGEWGLWPPQERLGVGSPSSVRREPSVPPRTIVFFPVRPSRCQGFLGIGNGARLAQQPVGHVAILPFDGHVGFSRSGSRPSSPPQPVAADRQDDRAPSRRNRGAGPSVSPRPRRRRFRRDARSPGGRRSSRARGVARGSRATNSAATRTAFVMRPLAIDGWIFTPWTVTTA